MKTLITFLIGICLTAGALSQGINYHRLGGVWGEPEPMMVVGFDLFEFDTNLWAETVTYTAFSVEKAFGGIGIRKDWNKPTYTLSAGVSIVAPIGNGWDKWNNLKLAANAGVRF